MHVCEAQRDSHYKLIRGSVLVADLLHFCCFIGFPLGCAAHVLLKVQLLLRCCAHSFCCRVSRFWCRVRLQELCTANLNYEYVLATRFVSCASGVAPI